MTFVIAGAVAQPVTLDAADTLSITRDPTVAIFTVESAHESVTPPLSPLSVVTADVSTGTPRTVNAPDTLVAPDIPTFPVEDVKTNDPRLTFRLAG